MAQICKSCGEVVKRNKLDWFLDILQIVCLVAFVIAVYVFNHGWEGKMNLTELLFNAFEMADR